MTNRERERTTRRKMVEEKRVKSDLKFNFSSVLMKKVCTSDLTEKNHLYFPREGRREKEIFFFFFGPF